MLLKVGGLDPSLRATGLSKANYNLETGEIDVTDLKLVETDKESGKKVRVNSDDLRRGSIQAAAIHDWITDCAVVFSEIPSGAQSANAAKALGMMTGVLSTVGVVGAFRGRLIQVMPTEVKWHACGTKNAAKEDMIEWAEFRWPTAPWLRVKKTGALLNKNEHLADACAAINAGVLTDEFKSLVQILRTVPTYGFVKSS